MEPTTIRIPDTIEEVKTQLGGLDHEVSGLKQLLTAKEWKRAASVYAFAEVYDGLGRPPKCRKSGKLSTYEFAALGIHGLRGDDAVHEYILAWQGAIDTGDAVIPKPGPRPKDSPFLAYLTCKQFADLGVQGLRSNRTVYEVAARVGVIVYPAPSTTCATMMEHPLEPPRRVSGHPVQS